MLDAAAIELSKHRLEQAAGALKDSETMLDADSYKTSINRSYYAIFHSMRAMLALENYDAKKHSGIIAEFRLRYIKTNIFPASFSKIIGEAFEIRNDADYEDFYIASESETRQQLDNAKEFFSAVSESIENSIAIFRQSCDN